MKRGLVAFFLTSLALALPALAHPLADKAQVIAEQAHTLQSRMGPAPGTTLSWGQQMALDDITRLAAAADAARSALKPDDVNLADVRPLITELQVAGNRVRMTLPVARLDEDGRKIGEGLMVQVQELELQALAARAEGVSEAEQQVSQNSGATQVNVGLGINPYGYGYGYGLGLWGYPYYGYGYGFGYNPYGYTLFGSRPYWGSYGAGYGYSHGYGHHNHGYSTGLAGGRIPGWNGGGRSNFQGFSGGRPVYSTGRNAGYSSVIRGNGLSGGFRAPSGGGSNLGRFNSGGGGSFRGGGGDFRGGGGGFRGGGGGGFHGGHGH